LEMGSDGVEQPQAHKLMEVGSDGAEQSGDCKMMEMGSDEHVELVDDDDNEGNRTYRRSEAPRMT
jgi:hypothetical protein